MKTYSNKIALIENSRGIYCFDTTMGCSSGMQTKGGCYNDCYAARSARTYGFDFSTTVLRNFESNKHRREILSAINNIKLDFIRIGCSGDPSENWNHTINILKLILGCNKEVVIITKHWNLLTDEQLTELSYMNICINTSVSALDNNDQLRRNINQYERIKPYCKSILRIVSCDFNLNNDKGHELAKIQSELFKHENIIDTVFRPSKNNTLVIDDVINVASGRFNGNTQLMSKFNRKTFTGKCSNCHQMCGVSMNVNNLFEHKPGIVKQLSIL